MELLQNIEDNYPDNEEVFYCEVCLSLGVLTCRGKDYCGECGSLEIKTTNIKDWENKYVSKYGEPYIKHSKNK